MKHSDGLTSNPDCTPHAGHATRPMSAYTALALALLHGIAGLSILIISSWFIAISSIAPLGFNYVIPAVVIRGLALLRIASGYATMWLGHKDLLSRIARERLAVFEQLAAKRLDNKAWTIEALASHTEQVASAFIAWISPLASVTLLMGGVVITGTLMAVPGTAAIVLLAIVWLLLSIWVVVKALHCVAVTANTELDFRQASATFFQASSIWHLKKSSPAGLQGAPSTQRVRDAQLSEQKLAVHALWLFQGAAFALVVSIVFIAQSSLFFVPLAVITPMVLLASPDWASASFGGLVKFSKWRHSQQALTAMHTESLPLLDAHKPKDSIELVDFTPSGRAVSAVNVTLCATGLTTIKGYSGSGKSSLLQALSGLMPYEGRRVIDGFATSQGVIKNWLYVEQQPIVLAGTLKLNLDPSATGISEDAMHGCLASVGLGYLSSLSTWVGKGGRPLSGGESKRLALVRAVLAEPDVLLIDEPFEGLDPVAQKRVAALINQVAINTLVVVATHVVPAVLDSDFTLHLKEKGEVSTMEARAACNTNEVINFMSSRGER